MKCRSSHQPYPIYTTVLTGKNLPPHLGYRTRFPNSAWSTLMGAIERRNISKPTQQKMIQTAFRESEAQTDPYVVDTVETNEDLEILTLDWLAWNYGLPAGINEVQTIERARQKRAWEAALPHPFDQASKDIRNIIIRAIEINEGKYREYLGAAASSLRMEIAEKIMRENCRKDKINYEERLGKYVQEKKEEKHKKIKRLRLNLNREIRKLSFARKGIDKKFRRRNIVQEFMDKTSEMYAPQLRYGENPKYRHEYIDDRCDYWEAFRKLEVLHHTTSDVPAPLKPAFDYEKKSKPRPERKDLCIRATKWSEENLEKLHQELTKIRRRRHAVPRPCHLKKKVQTVGVESETPTAQAIPDEEEEAYQACLLLQKTVKGRAVQAAMFEGRVKCQELIEELKSTHALRNHAKDVKAQMRRKIYELQRQAEITEMQNKRRDEILYALEGKTTGDILDFLAKELVRLQDERKTHAAALKADRERHEREAAEAGRRQEEEQRRREHDEMYKQIIKMHQNTALAFLEDVFEENRNWLAHREAREKIAETARDVDTAAFETAAVPIFTRPNDLKEEEIIADLIHNFALPEAEKRIVRQRLVNKQRNYLKVCHDEVYSAIERVSEGNRTATGELIPLPMLGKHKIPPAVRVKYLRLKRMHESSSSSGDSQKSQASERNALFPPTLAKEDSKTNEDNEAKTNEDTEAKTNEDTETKTNEDTETKTNQGQEEEKQEKAVWSSGFSRQEVIIESQNEEPKTQTE